jgi:hypothetical protein
MAEGKVEECVRQSEVQQLSRGSEKVIQHSSQQGHLAQTSDWHMRYVAQV